MVAVPGVTAVTAPVDETLATELLLVDQATARPVREFPAESFAEAARSTDCPTYMLAAAGDTVTVDTGTRLSVIDAVAALPSTVAVIVAVPGATPVTTPVADTLATPLLLVDQDTARPVSELPAESRALAARSTDPPT